MSNYPALKDLEKVESLAREAIRTAVGTITGTVDPGRASDAMREFSVAADPQTILDLIMAYRSALAELQDHLE